MGRKHFPTLGPSLSKRKENLFAKKTTSKVRWLIVALGLGAATGYMVHDHLSIAEDSGLHASNMADPYTRP
jgi:hypothetical protein